MKPTKIYTLGDYYNDEGLSCLCHDMKDGCNLDIISTFLIKSLIDQIPNNSVLIGVPVTFGRLVMEKISQHVPVLEEVFIKTRFISAYTRKKRGDIVTPDTIGIILNPAFDKTILNNYDNIIIVDNVIDTGATMSRCIQLLDRPCEAMCIAVNWENYNKNNW